LSEAPTPRWWLWAAFILLAIGFVLTVLEPVERDDLDGPPGKLPNPKVQLW
jgi:hypothetical protein